MSHADGQPPPANLTNAEKSYLGSWGDTYGLEVIAGAAMAFVGLGNGVASWGIYRAAGRLWLSDLDHRGGRQFEGSKVAVERIEQATDHIQTRGLRNAAHTPWGVVSLAD